MAFKIGMVKTYIRDYRFKYLVGIPVEVAIAWVKKVCPEHHLGSDILLKDMTIENVRESWNNKYWILIGCVNDTWIALNNSDGNFSIYTKKVENEDFESDKKTCVMYLLESSE